MGNPISEYEQELFEHNYHYKRLQKLIRESMPQIKITSIRKVHNKYLNLAFTVRKDEMRRRNGSSSAITEYIHATGSTKVASILKGNLNWRLIMRSKYGQGISFSHEAQYANKYCNNRNGWCRAFIFFDVLVGNRQTVYDNGDTHPPKNTDSYLSSTGYVLVKFDDFTFNPTFVVYYNEGEYDFNSHLYSGMCFDYEYNYLPAEDQQRNQEQLFLMKQILRMPLENEDFLNAIVAESNTRAQIIVQPRPIELPNQFTVKPKDSVRIEDDTERSVMPKEPERTRVDARQPIKKDPERKEMDAGQPVALQDSEPIRVHARQPAKKDSERIVIDAERPVIPKNSERILVHVKQPVEKDFERTEMDVRRPVRPTYLERIRVHGRQPADIEIIEIKSGLPALPQDPRRIRQIMALKAISKKMEEEAYLRSVVYSRGRHAEPTTSPNRKCRKFCYILLVFVVCAGITMLCELFFGKRSSLNKNT